MKCWEQSLTFWVLATALKASAAVTPRMLTRTLRSSHCYYLLSSSGWGNRCWERSCYQSSHTASRWQRCSSHRFFPLDPWSLLPVVLWSDMINTSSSPFLSLFDLQAREVLKILDKETEAQRFRWLAQDFTANRCYPLSKRIHLTSSWLCRTGETLACQRLVDCWYRWVSVCLF